jgi:hypothetical protein
VPCPLLLLLLLQAMEGLRSELAAQGARDSDSLRSAWGDVEARLEGTLGELAAALQEAKVATEVRPACLSLPQACAMHQYPASTSAAQ